MQISPKQNRKFIKHSGFSLVEIIVVIVVMSIISIGIVQYIVDSADGFSRTADRSELSSSGRVVIDRIAMELHNALPNSVRVTSAYTSGSAEVLAGDAYAGDQCIEFVPILSATTYIDPRFRPQPRTTTFTVVDITVYFLYRVKMDKVYVRNMSRVLL